MPGRPRRSSGRLTPPHYFIPKKVFWDSTNNGEQCIFIVQYLNICSSVAAALPWTAPNLVAAPVRAPATATNTKNVKQS